jgi:L-methionine (R)-S-oxide reductase
MDLCHEISAQLETGANSAALQSVLTLVLNRFNSETGTIHLLDREKGLLHLKAQVGLPPALLDAVTVIPVGKGIAGQTVARGEPVTLCNLQTDASGVARPNARQTGVGGTLCVPMRDGEMIVGTIGIGTRREYEYKADETQLLLEAGRVIGAAVGPTANGCQ